MNKLILVCLVLFFTQYVSAYSVSGNKLLGPDGNQVRLRGTNKCSFEWSPTGEQATLAQYQLKRSWGFNVIRLPLNQDFWLSGSRTYSSSYQANIAQQVAWIKSCGMGVILDLHWSDQGNLQASAADQQVMADLNSITFWGQVATAYKNDPWVMFELYNEPHDVSWSIWQTGGTSNGFTVAGMQQLYNAIRQTGANNVVIIGGLNWAYDLSGIGNGYAITGTNIAYATHDYDYPGKQSGDWDSGFGYLAATYPVIATEFGQYCNTGNYVSDILNYYEAKGIHWVAWAWYPGGCSFPAVINDWSGTPTAVGALVKNIASSSSSASTAAPSTSTTKPATGATSAPVTSSPATSSPSTSAPAAAGSNSVVFDNSLQNGWVDYSWATRSFTNTNPVYSGQNSISFTLSGYGGIYFHRSTGLTVGSYQSIQFYTNGPTANVQVRLYDNNNPIGTSVSLPSSSSGSWTLQTIPLSSCGTSSSTQFYGFAILYTQQSSGGMLYIDQVSVVAAGSSTPVTATPATSAPVTAAPVTAAPATAAPVTAAPATAAPVTAAPATAAPVTAAPATSAPVTPAPATAAPATNAPTTVAPATGGCSAANVVITQSLSTSFQQSGQTVNQYSVTIQNTCTSKTLQSLTISASSWNTVNYWNLQVSGTTITLPSYVTIGPSGSFSSIGYQNVGGQAGFTVTSATFA